jgi:flagellar basal-body rod modification protein FlgD
MSPASAASIFGYEEASMTTVTATPVPTTTTPTSSTSRTSSSSNALNNAEIASNFTEFLQLLTTQLQNQDPLSPMDTTQFTQQLVEFSQVEQQMQSNDQLSTLVSLEQTAQSTSALALVGATVVVNGSTVPMSNSTATWTLNASKPATATITISDSTGQTAYSGQFGVNAGQQTFNWSGVGNDGKQWPDGNYTLTATAVDASGQSTSISTQVQAKVDSVDLTQSPPVLSISGQNYTMDQLQQIVASGS